MSEPITLLCSPSQANTAKQCRRLWGFRYLDKIRSAPTASQAKGTNLHEVGENWLRDGTIPPATDIGKRFLAGIQHLPEPSPQLLVEHAFLFEDGDVHWRGFIDCVDPTGDIIVVIDHKTTKNFYWAKKPAELRLDTQSTIYAKAVMDKFGVTTIEARWVYYLTEGTPASRKVSITLDQEHVEQQYRGLRILGQELLKLKKKTTTGLEIPANYPNQSCRMFGGCEFSGICAAKKEGENMEDLMTRLRKMTDNGVEVGTQVAAVAINPPTTVKSTTPPKPSTPAIETASCDEKEPVKAKRGRGRPKGSKNKKTLEREAAPTGTTEREAHEARLALDKKVATERAELEQKIADQQAQNKPAPAKVVEVPDVDMKTGQVVTTTAEPGTSFRYMRFAAAIADSFILFINCIPDAGANSVNEILDKAAERAALSHDVSHYRFEDFGSGSGRLCTALEELLAANEPLKGNWYVMTDNQLHKDALPVLEKLADHVVRGIR